MRHLPTTVEMWKRLLQGEQILIAEHGLEKYKAGTVFVIKEMPDKKCKTCYGRGFMDRDIKVGRIVPCGCVKSFGLRAIAQLKEDEIVMDFNGNIYIAEGSEDANV